VTQPLQIAALTGPDRERADAWAEAYAAADRARFNRPVPPVEPRWLCGCSAELALRADGTCPRCSP
jgi:hypothetical protein